MTVFPENLQYFIHIGRHKSGTTAIQNALSNNVEALLDQGFYYPFSGMRGIAHHHISNYFLNPKKSDSNNYPLDEYIEALREELEGLDAGTNVIISSEAFQFLREPEKITQFFPKDNVRIVAYIREQVDYAVSVYCQTVHAQLYTNDFETYLRGEFHCNVNLFLNTWGNVFGWDKVIPGVFDRAELVGGDVVSDFLQKLGIDKSALSITKMDPNPTLGGALLEFKRALNHIAAEPKILQDSSYSVLSALARQSPEYRRKPSVSPVTAKIIRNKYKVTNFRCAHRYFDREILFRNLKDFSDPFPEYEPKDFEVIFERIRDHEDPKLYRFLNTHQDRITATDHPIMQQLNAWLLQQKD